MLNNYISEQSVMKMKNAQCKEKTFETSSCYLELTITCNAKRQKDAYYIMSTLILCTWHINVLNIERGKCFVKQPVLHITGIYC